MIIYGLHLIELNTINLYYIAVLFNINTGEVIMRWHFCRRVTRLFINWQQPEKAGVILCSY